MRIMGLDVGEKRIGVALSDLLGLTAQALCVLQRSDLERDIEALLELIRRHQVEKLVVGLPLNMDGSEGNKAGEARVFGDKLAHRAGLPVEYQDERLSTKAVENTLINADVSRRRRRQVIDKMAAAYILQGYLDRQAGTRRVDGD